MSSSEATSTAASAVTRHTLPNGLTVLLKEVHSTPIVCWAVLYQIGSRNERTGQTGISHWVEHMLFKATDMFPEGGLDKAVDRQGGSWNAFTSSDVTVYYETLPADRVALGLQIEADRMRSAKFHAHEVESERTVIISERQGYENYPTFWLREAVHAAAYRVHGYHHEIIGDMVDLETMTRDELYTHYATYYAPNNAIAVAVGAFDTAQMLADIEAHFGGIPARAVPPPFVRPEPPQQGERRVTVERPHNTAFVDVAYHVPPPTHDDWFALRALDALLAGPGGGVGNRTSLLYRALVETGLAIDVDGYLAQSIDPGLYTLTITVRDGQTPQACEAAFDALIDAVAASGVDEAALARAKKQLRAAYAYSMERVTSQAFALVRAEAMGSYTWVETFPARIDAVTPDDVRRVAQMYLRRANRTVGVFVPLPSGADGLGTAADGDAFDDDDINEELEA